MAIERIDLFQQFAADYEAAETPRLLTPGAGPYLSLLGRGRPGGRCLFSEKPALFDTLYGVQMALRFDGKEFVFGKLEVLYWGRKKDEDFVGLPPEEWNWKLMMRVPEVLTQDILDQAVAQLQRKGKPSELGKVRLGVIAEGPSVQMLHKGTYADATESIEQMRVFAAEQGMVFSERHHEIYLNDPREVAEGELLTILRRPVASA